MSFQLTSQETYAVAIITFSVLIGSVLVRFQTDNSALSWMHIIDNENYIIARDINSIDLDGLVNIPFIGEKTAEIILSHRRHNGPFESLDELSKLEGISAGRMRQIRKYLTINH